MAYILWLVVIYFAVHSALSLAAVARQAKDKNRDYLAFWGSLAAAFEISSATELLLHFLLTSADKTYDSPLLVYLAVTMLGAALYLRLVAFLYNRRRRRGGQVRPNA